MTERGVWAMRCKAGLSEASTEPAIISRLNKRQTLGQSLSEHFSVTVAQSERKPEAEKCDTDAPPTVGAGSRPTAEKDRQQQQHTVRLAACGGLGREDLGQYYRVIRPPPFGGGWYL